MGGGEDLQFDLTGKVVLVAGAAGGLGRPIALDVARRGARVVALDRDGDALAALARDGGFEPPLMADIADEPALIDAVDRAIAHHGRLDGVVNAAGVLPIATALDMPVEIFRDCLEANLTGAFLLSRVAAARMDDDGGRIVHIASVSSAVANAGYAAYASSKAGLANLVRVLAREWAGRNITVNAIGPAMTETPLTAGYLADPEFRRQARAVIPMDRLGTADDLLATVTLLLAPGGAFITGQTIYIDGGRTLV